MQTETEIQNEILRRMTPTQKLQLSMRLYYSAWQFKTAWLRQLHQDWSKEQIEQEAKRIFSNARS